MNHSLSLPERYWYIEVGDKLIAKNEYYFNRMDRKEHIPTKKERLKEYLISLQSQDLSMIEPRRRKEAILYRLKLIEEARKEYNDACKEPNETTSNSLLPHINGGNSTMANNC